MQPVFKNVKDAASELGIATSTLRRMASAGKIPALQMGGGEKKGKYLFNVDQVREFLLKQAAA